MGGIDPRFVAFPSSLRDRVRHAVLADVPALIAHPDWESPSPVMFWMHGRTVSKELDSGRYLRWIRAGIAALAVDLPGHGERPGPRMHDPSFTPQVIAQMVGEIDPVLRALSERDDAHLFDLGRIGIGGMSAGGMVTLRRLCEPHTFRCAAVESTTGWLAELYHPSHSPARRWPADHDAETISEIDPMDHLEGFRPIPLLSLHSEADEVVPFTGMKHFLERLGDHYEAAGADRSMIELHTWPWTGAPSEHAGFGKVAAEAKTLQVEFLKRTLLVP